MTLPGSKNCKDIDIFSTGLRVLYAAGGGQRMSKRELKVLLADRDIRSCVGKLATSSSIATTTRLRAVLWTPQQKDPRKNYNKE